MFRKLFAGFAFLTTALFAVPAMATTDCSSTVAWVYSDAGSGSGQIAAALASGSSFYIPATDPMFKTLAGGLYMSLITQATVVVRFSASSVSCSASFGRTDVVAIYNYAS